MFLSGGGGGGAGGTPRRMRLPLARAAHAASRPLLSHSRTQRNIFSLIAITLTAQADVCTRRPMGARVVVVAGRGGLRWWQGTRVVVVRCVLLAETAMGRPKQ